MTESVSHKKLKWAKENGSWYATSGRATIVILKGADERKWGWAIRFDGLYPQHLFFERGSFKTQIIAKREVEALYFETIQDAFGFSIVKEKTCNET